MIRPTRWQLRCDQLECQATCYDDDPFLLRDEAQRDGWQLNVPHNGIRVIRDGKDYCPDHRKDGTHRTLTTGEQRTADYVASREAEWATLKARITVSVSVAYSVTYGVSRRSSTVWVAGVDHIVVWEPVRVGKLHREPGQALCETKTRRIHLDNSKNERRDQDAGQSNRHPTCETCLKIAWRLTG